MPFATLLALVAACRISEVVSTSEPLTGPGTVYALASANEITLPATFTQEGGSFEIRKGALTLGTDSTYIFSLAVRSSTNGSQPANSTTTFRGSFTRTGDALTLLQLGDTLFRGTYAPTNVNLLRQAAQITGDRFTFVR
ncbi:MAG: hypothetical protein ABI910_15385 [Gemmatimonadota bacterium]